MNDEERWFLLNSIALLLSFGGQNPPDVLSKKGHADAIVWLGDKGLAEQTVDPPMWRITNKGEALRDEILSLPGRMQQPAWVFTEKEVL